MLHQAADHAEGQDRGALADQQPEMRTVRADHAQGEQPTQSGMRDDARPVVEQARVESRLPDDRIRIEAELAQGRGNLLGDTELNAARRKRAAGVGHDGWRRRSGVVPAAARETEHTRVDHHGCLAEIQHGSRRTAWSV